MSYGEISTSGPGLNVVQLRSLTFWDNGSDVLIGQLVILGWIRGLQPDPVTHHLLHAPEWPHLAPPR